MFMNTSHIAENVLTREQAVAVGLSGNKRINYHGLGKKLFLDAVDSMDNNIEVFRWNTKHGPYGEKDYLIITETQDQKGNSIIVPLIIENDTEKYINNVIPLTNVIKSVYGKKDLRQYINEKVDKKQEKREA